MGYFMSLFVLAALSATTALASSAARIPSTTEGSASMTPLMLGDGGLARYWWIVVVVLLAAAAFWYFLRRNRRAV